MNKEKFHLGHILTITHGKIMTVGEKYPIDGVYKILNFMTGDNLYTHALPRAARECAPWLFRWYPWLKEIDYGTREINENNYKEILKEFTDKYGEYHEVERIPIDDHAVKNPIEELAEMVDMKKIFCVRGKESNDKTDKV